MKYITLFLLFAGSYSFGCENKIPESEAIKAVALQAGAGSFSCEQKPLEPCICFDGIDWRRVDYDSTNKVLVINPTKSAAVDAAIAASLAEVTQRRQAIQALKAIDLSTLDLAGMKTFLKNSFPFVFECVREDLKK